MVEPITIFLAATTIISFLTTGINWIKNVISTESPTPVPLSIGTQTYRPAIHPPSINQDTPRIEYDDFKQKKESLPSYESNDHKSSSNSSSAVGVIFSITLILAVMGFVIYRKRNKLKENQLRFRQIESPPSPPTTQTDLNLTIV